MVQYENTSVGTGVYDRVTELFSLIKGRNELDNIEFERLRHILRA